MVSVELRPVVAVFAETESPTELEPVPLAEVVNVIQVGKPVTVQVQLADVVMLTLALPPEAGSEALGAESEYAQAAACCVSV